MPRSRARGASVVEVARDTSPVAARARGLVKEYGSGPTRVTAVAGVDVDLDRGGFTAIMGPSGSGKSTLMQCLAGLDTATRGSVAIGGTELGGLSDAALTELRGTRLGFVFQAFNLLPTLTALENITLPVEIAGRRVDRAHLDRIVEATGLAGRLAHRPAEMSGGQQQRVAVARALVSRPELVFADEPTGNLDSRAGTEVLGLLRRGVDEWGQTVVMVTHDPSAAAYAERVVFLADGRIVDDLADPTADAVYARMRRFDGRGPDVAPREPGPDGVGFDVGAGVVGRDPGRGAARREPGPGGAGSDLGAGTARRDAGPGVIGRDLGAGAARRDAGPGVIGRDLGAGAARRGPGPGGVGSDPGRGAAGRGPGPGIARRDAGPHGVPPGGTASFRVAGGHPGEVRS